MIIPIPTLLAKPSFTGSSLFLMILLLLNTPSHGDEAKQCGPLVKEALRSTPDSARVPKENCPISHTFIKWLSVQKKGSFEEVRAFMEAHPNWPRQTSLRRQAEKDLLDRKLATKEVITWLEAYPPLSIDGLKAYARAILQSGNMYSPETSHFLTQTILSMDSSGAEIKEAIKDLREIYGDKLIFKKITQYLNKGDSTSARQLLSLSLSTNEAQAASIRLKLQEKGAAVASIAKSADSLDLSDFAKKGILLEQIRAYRKADQNDEAKALLATLVLEKEENSEKDLVGWSETAWTERNLIARRYLEESNYQKAYEILQGHGLTRGENFANAEFLSGWIALRFLKKPELALHHFEKLHDGVKSPISVARARFWLAKTHDDLGEKAASKNWYELAKVHKATYYGQLAHKEVTGQAPSIKPAALSVDSTTRDRFHGRDLVKTINLLADIGETSYCLENPSNPRSITVPPWAFKRTYEQVQPSTECSGWSRRV